MNDSIGKNDDKRDDAASIGNCEHCGAVLYGELAVESKIVEGTGLIAIREVSERNWLLCDGCSALLCHQCCQHPSTGLCNACLNLMEKESGFPPLRMLLLTSAPPSGDAKREEENRCRPEA